MSAFAQRGMAAPRTHNGTRRTPHGYITTPELCRRTGLTPRQVDHWCRRGYLGADKPRFVGSGNCRLWTQDDVRRLRWVAEQIAQAPTIADLWVMSDKAAS